MWKNLHTAYYFILYFTLRGFVARHLLSRIYALSSVKFLGLKLRLCKKKDKYEVCKRQTKHKLNPGVIRHKKIKSTFHSTLIICLFTKTSKNKLRRFYNKFFANVFRYARKHENMPQNIPTLVRSRTRSGTLTLKSVASTFSEKCYNMISSKKFWIINMNYWLCLVPLMKHESYWWEKTRVKKWVKRGQKMAKNHENPKIRAFLHYQL